MAVAESVPEADTRFVCIIRRAIRQYFNTDTERRAGLSAIAERLVYTIYKHRKLSSYGITLRLISINLNQSSFISGMTERRPRIHNKHNIHSKSYVPNICLYRAFV